MKTCRYCGSVFADDDRFCGSCGMRLDGGRRESVSKKSSVKDASPKLAFAVVAVLCVAAVVLITRADNKRKAERSEPVRSEPVYETLAPAPAAQEVRDEPAAAPPAPASQEVEAPITVSGRGIAAEPFYGIWCAAYLTQEEAEAFAAEMSAFGYPAEVILTCEWSNLNPLRYYAVTAGRYASESAAYSELDHVCSFYGDAYVKYSGELTA